MTARCIICSKNKRFRNHRGAKLSYQRCDCGGTLEIIGGSYTLSGKHPFDESLTYSGRYYEGDWFYAEANRKKEYFVYYHGYYHKIEKPVIAKRLLSSEQNPERSVATEADSSTNAGQTNRIKK